MVIRIVVAGVSQCDVFAEICLIVDYLSQNLPNFCFERIEKSVVDWKVWLCKVNQKNKWHHETSPLVWKELLMKGSRPYYIGGASEFLEYCYSYYKLDLFVSPDNFEGLVENFAQFTKKIQKQEIANADKSRILKLNQNEKKPIQNNYVVCISGAAYPLAMNLISGLLDMSDGDKSIMKIYLYDSECSQAFMEFVERECSYIGTNYPGKVVKYVEKIGVALTHSDLLIILDHVPFDIEAPIGDWLQANKNLMHDLAFMINASASRKMYIIFPNLGPACFNATVLRSSLTSNVNKSNIVVATSDLGLNIAKTAAEIAEIPMRSMFCPPVWGFVGVNHLVDIRTTFHKYNSFVPYNRYTRVRNSTLNIGYITPEMRTMEYLMHFDETLWLKIAEKKKNIPEGQIPLNKAVAVLDVVKLWLFVKNPDYVVNLGVLCDGSFGLTFDGFFSQPARLVDNLWKPASDCLLPKDPQMKLSYLEQTAENMMILQHGELPKIVQYYPCSCKTKYVKQKNVWL